MKIILFLLSLMTYLNSYSQNSLYIVTEKHDGIIGFAPSYDSIYVTSPSGITTGYNIPHYLTNPSGHNSQLSLILNGIISQGYRIIEMGDHGNIAVNNSLIGGNYIFNIYTIFLGKPWTTAGLVPAGVNNSLIKIINVFPNPTSDVVNLKFSSSSNNSKLYLIHSGGYIINEYDVSNLTDFSVNTSLLNNGKYLFILVSNGVYSESKTIIKQ